MRTRKYLMDGTACMAVKNLQWGRVVEDAEVM